MTASVNEALELLDLVMGPRSEEQLAKESEFRLRRRLDSMGVHMPASSGIGMVTKGCPECGGTMISNYEQDEKGNIINQGSFICTNCGAQG